MTTFTEKEIEIIDIIKYHIITDSEKKGVDLAAGTVTDKLAIQYALSLTERYIKELYPMPTKKKNILQFRKTK